MFSVTAPAFSPFKIPSLFLSSVLLLVPMAFAYGLSDSPFIAGAVGIAVFLSWLRPKWVLLGLVLLAPLTRSPDSRVFPSQIADGKTCLALILAACWACRRIVEKEEWRLPRAVSVFLFLWVSWAILCSFHSERPALGLDYTAASLAGIGLFVMAFHEDEQFRKRIGLSALAAIAGNATLAVVQYVMIRYDWFSGLQKWILPPRTQIYAQIYSLAGPEALTRVSGALLHPNHLGALLALGIPFVVASLAHPFQKIQRLGLVFIAVLLCTGLYLSNSRSSILAVGMSLGYMGFHRSFRRWFAGGAIAVLLIGAVCLLSSRRAEIADFIVEKARVHHGLSGRETVWKNAGELFLQSPLWGVGPGQFPYEYVEQFGYFIFDNPAEQMEQLWFIQNLQDRIIPSYHAHNIYIGSAVELGVAGPVLFLVGAGLVFWYCRRGEGASSPSLSGALSLAAASVAVGVLFFGMFESQMAFVRGSLNLIAGPVLAIGWPWPGRAT